jgi:hypothetical protein
MSGRRGRSEDHSSGSHENSESSDGKVTQEPPGSPGRRSHSADLAGGGDDAASVTSSAAGSTSSRGRTGGLMGRLRDRSRSRSRSRKDIHDAGAADSSGGKEMLVAVTSCRSDGYYNQKAPGSTSKLPRKAPANLKLFHELAVGVKDAYAAVGATPRKPVDDKDDPKAANNSDRVLWEFVGNLDFVSVWAASSCGMGENCGMRFVFSHKFVGLLYFFYLFARP